jgi:hypothetical protein
LDPKNSQSTWERERERADPSTWSCKKQTSKTKNPKWHEKTCKGCKITGCKTALNFSFTTKDSIKFFFYNLDSSNTEAKLQKKNSIFKFFSYNLDKSNTEAKLRNPEKRQELEIVDQAVCEGKEEKEKKLLNFRSSAVLEKQGGQRIGLCWILISSLRRTKEQTGFLISSSLCKKKLRM